MSYDARRFEKMRRMLEEMYPDFTPGQIRHCQNVISNFLRSFKNDNYGVELSVDGQFPKVHGYYSYDEVKACGVTIYLRITVD